MTPCVESLAIVDKRVTEINRTLVRAISPIIKADWLVCKFFCRVFRLPSELRLYFMAISAEKEARRNITDFRNSLLQGKCSSATYDEVIMELRAVVSNTNGVLEQAYASAVPGYILVRMENYYHLWTDLVEDLEVATDQECRTLFDELAAELAKRQ